VGSSKWKLIFFIYEESNEIGERGSPRSGHRDHCIKYMVPTGQLLLQLFLLLLLLRTSFTVPLTI